MLKQLLLLLVISILILPSHSSLFGFSVPDNRLSLSTVIDKWINKSHTVQAFNLGWSGDDKILNTHFNNLQNCWNQYGHVPFVNWMPYAWRNWTNPSPNDIVANGGYDDYILKYVQKMKVYLAGPDGKWDTEDDRRVFIRFAHQMNGNWFPWSPSCAWSCEQNGQKIKQSVNSYVNMWKRVVEIFDDNGCRDKSHIQFVWSVNNINFQAPIHEFYPGDYFVDWVGLDGYNFGNTIPQHDWETPHQVFQDMISTVRNITTDKPLAITEYGSVTAPRGVDEKVLWISDAFEIFKSEDVRLIISNNNDGGNTDFAMFGGTKGDERFTGYNGYSSYRKSLLDDKYLPSTKQNPRLISDSMFNTGIDTPPPN